MNELNIRSEIIKDTINKFANSLRAENIEERNHLELYAVQETVEKVNNINNQVIYGRRGTGKTHLILALRDKLTESFFKDRILPTYIDLRRIKPLIQHSKDDAILYSIVAFKLIIQEIFKNVLNDLIFINGIENYIDYSIYESIKKPEISRILEDLNLNFNGKNIEKIGLIDFSSEEIKNLKNSISLSRDPNLNIESNTNEKVEHKSQKVKVITFNNIIDNLEYLLKNLNIKILCLLDEWAEIPIITQPFLAELLKRVFIPSKFIFKIAAIPFRTRLLIKHENENFGLEEGGDIFAYHLDNKYVFELNKQETRDFYNELLYRHLNLINPNIIENPDKEEIEKLKQNYINQFFANQALSEILIASGGIPRDFCFLMISSYEKFILNRTTSYKRIFLRNVREATTEWYSSDKREHIDENPNLKLLLSMLVEEIIINKKKTQFLLPQKYENNKYIQELIDLRALHLRKRGYSHQDIQGVVFNVYSVDYGCYTSINIQKKDLETQILDFINTAEDLREIRRVALQDDFFQKFLMSAGEGIKCSKCGKIIDTNHLAYTKQSLCNHCYEKI